MCDTCSDFIQLLVSYETKVCREANELPLLYSKDIEVVNSYVQAWTTRQCMCCYRDSKNLERFSYVTQGLIYQAVCCCKSLAEKGSESTTTRQDAKDEEKEDEIQDTDKLLNLISKIFLLNFPLYVAYKHTIQTKIDEITQQELQNLNLFCDMHDSEIPIYLLKNVSWFCKIGGLLAMTSCFTMLTPDLLPVTTAHAMISVVCNLKLWLNYKSMVTMLVPLRSCVLRYMCKLSDRDLRTPTIKSMADFMWNAIKDPLDTPVAFDVDGLDLAFKYFTSSTLTMRLAGITQINNQIGVLAEICVGEAMPEAEAAPRHMADWLIANNIISHIFGPNLHVEVIKQSHIILNFLAMEGRITCAHMDVIWAAAQLKHCAKPVHDLLPGLVKHLSAAPTLHLYNLLTKLEPKDHTEQTLFLASVLIKAVWTRGGTTVPEGGLINLAAENAGITSYKCATSSENSVSLEGSNSEEDHGDSTGQSESHKSDSEYLGGVDIEEDTPDGTAPPPCKIPRKHLRRRSRCIASSSDPELDGIPIKRGISEKTKKSLVAKAKSHKRQKELAVRKKLMNALNIVIPDPLSHVSGAGRSSSSQEEGDEDESIKLRKRRKILRKTRVKKQKDNPNRISDIMHEIEDIMESSLKSPTYMEDSSSCSEMGKEAVMMMENRGANMDPDYFAVGSKRHILEMLSGEEAEMEGDNDGSYSSRMSNKSEKNMADFDGEDSGCEEELVQLAVHVQMKAMSSQSSPDKSPVRVDPCLSSNFKADNVCVPGNTLLWDLLQDDKIGQLGEGLALEAEKTLCNLICYTPDKEIRMKFIEGCLKNLENHCSVVVSLRMLPKLLTSFRGMDMHNVTHWAEKQHHMMKHFFNDLKVYTSKPVNSLPLYSHIMQIQVRLHFLSAVFSPVVSPSSFNFLSPQDRPEMNLNQLYPPVSRFYLHLEETPNLKLSIEQVDTLWECLAHDSECSDELFSWLLSQTKTNELHALKVDALRRLYIHHLPSLPLEKYSMICLSLFQHLCSLNNFLMVKDRDSSKNGHNVGMDHMWKIALRATNTDVSMAAMQYINSYYIGHNLQHEGQFMRQCMTHLQAATEDLISSGTGVEDPPLLCIQRALLLMKSHLDAFKRRYAYHLRKWALGGKGIGSHSANLGDKSGSPIRLVIQSGSSTERCFLDLSSSDYVAELRAEIVNWCESLSQMKNPDSDNTTVRSGETWIRIITQGQELTVDCDEKTLGDMGFKDNQMIYISVGVSRNMKKKEYMDSPSMQPPPPRESIPALLLLQPNYFEQLFSLMHTLSSMKTQIKGGRHVPHTKGQVLSRRVWDILSLLPTSPTLLSGFQKLDTPLNELLNPSSAQKLMYSLYIIESLSANNTHLRGNEKEENQHSWCHKFIQYGGLRHLFDIFKSGVLQRDGGDGCEWQQDCLASLLKTLYQLGVEQWISEMRQTRTEKVVIPNLNEAMISMMDVKTTLPQLTSILEEASLPKDLNQYKTGLWGRSQVVHYALGLLVSWLHSSEEAQEALFTMPNFSTWLKRLVLEDPEPAVRRETCSAIYKLCLGIPATSNNPEFTLVAPMLVKLLLFLEIAENMRPTKNEMQVAEDGKEPYGPACRDYFWLVSRLIDGLPEELIKESIEDPQNCIIDINNLCAKMAKSLLNREFLETRHRTVDDDGLIGLLNLLTNLIRFKPPFQTSKAGQELLNEVFEFLFALPTPKLRHVPKCKSARARSSAFDLLVEFVKGSPENYAILHEKLLKQHQPGPHSPYPWDYWPHEDGRSECGYVGLTNLGATCYMASCMQHLYMMPQARASILEADTDQAKHENTLKELQRMFAYLLESERKAYNPRSFCKVYTMDHQPLNTAEQKDMAEFFIDLVSKLEEMTPQLKSVIKKLFCGIISNNVVSLDCDHVSCTLEEFYTVRCQVADMRNLYESLDEVTVKDTLEGDNMYTCSQCGKKVRAEKRACFKKLPQILCFNTMRYTFNMLTMLKEKVNTHFSFPMRLNMAGYTEKELMTQQYKEEKAKQTEHEPEQYEYDLIGVTVHTGTADGGHYYSFIKDRSAGSRDKWFLFNDAEVKPFDPNQIAAECFGGEVTSKTYDSVTDKFMDFSFEKSNSAYMLFYEQSPVINCDSAESASSTLESNENLYLQASSTSVTTTPSTPVTPTLELSKELENWIWQDNMHFIQDKNIFEHTYFNFMWQICGYIPQTILPVEPNITQKATQLSTSFFIETFIHAKEKPTMVQWVELVTKQFNACQEACVWFLDHMSKDTWWPVQVLLKCPNQMVRQMYQRLCIHVIQRLKPTHSPLYLQIDDDVPEDERDNVDAAKIGNASCVTRFIKTLLSLMEHGAKAHLKHLTEYFGFLYEFSKMGDEECKFLLAVGAISTTVNFYLGQKANDFVDVSEGEEEEEMIALPTDKYKPASLDKMITLIASLVEKSRDSNMKINLSENDYEAVATGKGFPFLYQQIKDNINLHQTRNLIHSLSRNNNSLAQSIISMISQAISRHSETCQPFFKILTLLTETTSIAASSSSSQPCFTQLVLQKVWEAAESCPYSALDWLALQVTRNRLVHQWVLGSMDSWLEHYLIAHNNQRVRNAAGYLLVSLVPSTPFRQGFRATHHRLQREAQLTPEAQVVLHQIYTGLLRLLLGAKHYTDMQQHGTMKLTTYFALLMYCCIGRTEKLLFGQYFIQLWHLFHPKLSEPSIPAYHNKQALLAFWNHVCTDCPENVQLMLQNAHVTKNIAFNYILADHDDQEIIMYNRAMLPAYYGILRMMCQQSKVFTRHLAQHQNLQWAFKNITPHPTQYPQAVDELFKLMQLMVLKHPETTEVEQREICSFRRNTLMTYLQCLDGRTSWGTLISAFKILLESNDDKLYVVYNRGLQIVFESFQNLHVMLHEATACHVSGDLLDILSIMQDLIRCIRTYRDSKDARGIILASKDWIEVISKLATLLNTYNPSELRCLCIDVLKEFILIMPSDALTILVPLLSHCHSAFQDNQDAVPLGPYFPRRGHTIPVVAGKGGARPLRPMIQMTVPHNQLECSRGIDSEYDEALDKFYTPYHEFIDVLFRLAVNNDSVTEPLVNLSAVVGFEAAPLHYTFFPKLWLDIMNTPHLDQKYITTLTTSNYLIDYVDAILLDERISLTIDVIYNFLVAVFPKISEHVLTEQTLTMIDNTVVTLSEQVSSLDIQKTAQRLSGDLRALILVYNSPEAVPPPLLKSTLKQLQTRVTEELGELQSKELTTTKKNDEPLPSTSRDMKSENSQVEKSSTSRCDSDSNTMNSSDESNKKQPISTVNVKLLNSVIKDLLVVVDKKL
ncbi:ubiquitin carboxyl-terminal hydrolase 34 isoform X3 [Coccinella septempunctata]|uniref:ubiquitin carboxyl-terminal hydrolase 34 isoform X3 n=1 Tax=Coccinella septempunctata TaxID=41139 RepID=UPI001D067C55|nr:ubiquitin carboxyl-terminal hydrolase 34 isoform X3 [Coccinella septempunctata]